MLPRMWILAFGIALLCTSAEAVPCRDDSCQKKESEDRDASSIELKPMRAGDRSYGAWRMLVKDPPPGLSVKDELPSGLPKKDELPPGQRDELDWRGREWRKRVATLPAIPTQESGSASLPIPSRPRSYPLAAGLLLADAAVR
jgi:hypothetical protein